MGKKEEEEGCGVSLLVCMKGSSVNPFGIKYDQFLDQM